MTKNISLEMLFPNDPELLGYTDEQLQDLRVRGTLHSLQLVAQLQENIRALDQITTEMNRRKKK